MVVVIVKFADGKKMSEQKLHMYKENLKSLNWFVGCRHCCVYCAPSFQRQMKRQKCELCHDYVPHVHLERLEKPPPKTMGKEFIFFPSSGDVAFAPKSAVCQAMDYARKYSDRTFLMQSKNPECFFRYDIPKNVIVGSTIETNRICFYTPSQYSYYAWISTAPLPEKRFLAMTNLTSLVRREVTIEPILDFDLYILNNWIHRINPEFVYIGYDNHRCFLPEAPLAKTLELIDDLKKFTEVRLKTIRPAWWENE